MIADHCQKKVMFVTGRRHSSAVLCNVDKNTSATSTGNERNEVADSSQTSDYIVAVEL
jgi:hypothetical protein